MSYTENAKVITVYYEYHDLLCRLTCDLHLDFGGSQQSFGGLSLDATVGPDYVRSICELFAVERLDDVIGKPCIALRCFTEWNTPIEGLEVPDGRRFILTAWRRKHFPQTEDPLTAKTGRIRQEIVFLERRLREETNALRTVTSNYHEWTP